MAGCASLQKALGLKTDLKGKPVKKIAIDVVGAEALCPGFEAPLIVTAVLDDGKRLVTEGAGDGKVTWDNYEVAAKGGQVSSGGTFAMAPDPRDTIKEGASIDVRSKHHKNITAEATVPPRYDCGYVANFSGRTGRHGANGRAGRRGRDGTDNQSSGSYAEPGGHGEHGGDGGHGADGEPGEDGEDVAVYVSLLEHPETEAPRLKVRVESQTTDHTEIFLIDPNGGSLIVAANGGAGGNGGNGGSGGTGGGGGTGAPPGNGGDGGDGGDGANGAPGGDGGHIELIADPAAKQYLTAIKLENAGGPGGQPGQAGFGGSGGNTFSGGQAGRRGENGRAGTRTGRPGRPGPEPEIYIEPVAQAW